MVKKVIAAGIAAGAIFASAIPAFAAQNLIGAGFSGADPGTVGPEISGELYGNTSNPSGNGEGVLPSFSPGPWVCEETPDCSGPTDPGGSMGVFLAPLASGGEGTPLFADGNDPDIDFSLHP